MKIHYLSDLHCDHYISETKGTEKQNRQLTEFLRLTGISKIPQEERYMLIIPGDLSNYNSVAKVVLIKFKELFKHVLLVNGNHDLYMCSSSQAKKYNFNSFGRLSEIKQFCTENDIIFLDGQIVEIDGKRFGGLGMFWDKSYYNYLEKREASDNEVLNFYNNYMNDSRFIMNGEEPYKIPLAYGGSYFKTSFNAIEYFEQEYKKLQMYNDYDDIDVMVSHYVPTVPHGMKTQYALERGTTFYMFDGEKDIERIQPKIWLFGHTHDKYDFLYKDVRFLCNPFGYVGETPYVVDWFEI